MSFSPQLLALAEYLAGEFNNRLQALDDPVWYVNLCLWQVPVSLFPQDSITIFAEQANAVKLDQPYRQRIMRISETGDSQIPLQVQYYMFKDPGIFAGGGSNPNLLKHITPEHLELLAGCVLNVSVQEIGVNRYQFYATPQSNACCTFTYLGNIVQVSLGFEVTQQELKTYDKGIDPVTGSATWGAILGPYHYIKYKQLDFGLID
jgi:CpeT/CpcT family (DUF1001)